MSGHAQRRGVERSAVAAAMPVIAILPVWAIAITVFWLPVRAVVDVPWWMFAGIHLLAGVGLFWRPFQRLVLTRLIGARRPHPSEAKKLERAWRDVAQVNGISPGRFLVTVIDADDLNAFACGGHLLVVTSFAVAELPAEELSGVLAHELSHHLGSHTVAATVGMWLSLPVLVLSRIGFFLQSVAGAATQSFARGSAVLTVIGQLVGAVLTAVAWVFMSGLAASNWVSNRIGKAAEFQADRRVVEMGFGRELSNSLRRFIERGLEPAPHHRRQRLHRGSSHPPARTRVARIDALLRIERRRAARP
jgi:Zn-dependent protease with chaperone function